MVDKICKVNSKISHEGVPGSFLEIMLIEMNCFVCPTRPNSVAFQDEDNWNSKDIPLEKRSLPLID